VKLCAMTQCIIYRRWHVRAVLWRAVWEINELAKYCSSEVTEERTKSQTIDWCGINVAGRHLGNSQEYSVFHVFGAPKKRQPFCNRVTAGRTYTHGAEKVVPSNMRSFVRLKETAGAAATGCIGSGRVLGPWRGREIGPRCRPRDMRCDIGGLFHLRYTRLDPDGHGKISGMDHMSPINDDLLEPSRWPFSLTDCRGGRPTPAGPGFATRSSVPLILWSSERTEACGILVTSHLL